MGRGKRTPKDRDPDKPGFWPDQEDEREIEPGMEDDVEASVDEKLLQAWQPQIVENRPEQKAIKELEPTIRHTWQLTAVAAAISLGMVLAEISQRRTVGYQGLLTMDAILLVALGFGAFSYQRTIAYLLVGWAALCTGLIYSLDQPLSDTQAMTWLLVRLVFILVFIRGARAVAKRSKLRRGQSRENTLRWREAVYNLKGPAAVILAAGMIMHYTYNSWMDALSGGDGSPTFMQASSGGGGSPGGTIIRSASKQKAKNGIMGLWNEIFQSDPDEEERDTDEEGFEELQDEIDEAWEAHQELAREAQEDGKNAGEGGDPETCQEQVLRRQRECQDEACRKVNLVFLGNCLGESTAAPDYCLSIPKLDDQTTGFAWRDASCRLWVANAKQGPLLTLGGSLIDQDYLRSDRAKLDCAAFYTRLQYHCHGSERE